ncbi:type II toxin-antitoxin system HigB family toxin [Pseudomonas fuscovaginae UPB0736]|uniref:type II toxin-antitoxin system HigB family toxin n=1 Tax=Pseudomonas asplenii TaxID=53407 RepID=UPI000289A267|nr:type II toxin-antitoxin system HigB family toxin [Pseudomonas fuscovaginae]UUQ67141.1 type II toxin-antitoxin system HigB family toxin [Pseudomonas fuscovaginae UPB0736]
MRVITEKRIREAKAKWPGAASALDAWCRRIKGSSPGSFSALKAIFPATDKVGSLHVFDIGGNKLRLIAGVHYGAQQLYIKHVLDHREYDKGKWKETCG